MGAAQDVKTKMSSSMSAHAFLLCIMKARIVRPLSNAITRLQVELARALPYANSCCRAQEASSKNPSPKNHSSGCVSLLTGALPVAPKPAVVRSPRLALGVTLLVCGADVTTGMAPSTVSKAAKGSSEPAAGVLLATLAAAADGAA